MKDNEQALLEKEKKSLVQEKKHTSNNEKYWTVTLTSKLKDTRTVDEIIDNVPPKEDIVNTVSFDGILTSFKSAKGMYYKAYIELQKTVKHDTKKVVFVLKPKIITPVAIKISEYRPFQIKFSNDTIDIHNVDIVYQHNTDPILDSLDAKDAIMTAELSLDIINQLRTAQSGITMVFNANGDILTLPLPQVFIEYVKEF